MLNSKVCNRCKAQKPLELFHRKAKAPDGRQSMCKACNTDWVRGRYAKNKATHIASVRRSRRQRQKSLRTMLRDIKVKSGCVDCGYNEHFHALDFDHLGLIPKTMNVSVMCTRGWSVKRILDEVAKCEVRCANCHRIRTWERFLSKVAER